MNVTIRSTDRDWLAGLNVVIGVCGVHVGLFGLTLMGVPMVPVIWPSPLLFAFASILLILSAIFWLASWKFSARNILSIVGAITHGTAIICAVVSIAFVWVYILPQSPTPIETRLGGVDLMTGSLCLVVFPAVVLVLGALELRFFWKCGGMEKKL
jgi:hypothetical protein